MSCDDGLVMTLHPGVQRNHHPATFARYGADTGHDIPVAVEYTKSLQPLLERYGTHPNLHLVLFTLDADVFSREIAPLAGFYPAVYAGAPWWFLDNPSEIRSFQRSVTEIAGLTRLSGFIDDTRAFCSIPARHDMSRRLDAGFLAGLVAEHRLDEDEALDSLVGPGHRPTPKGVQAMTISTQDSTASGCHGRRPAVPLPAATAAPPHPCGSCIWVSGNFFRAHQAWYTDNASDAAEWGIAAFTGRSTALADGAHRAGRPLHVDHPGGCRRHLPGVGQRVQGPSRTRHRSLARVPGRSCRYGSSPSPSPRPVMSAEPTADLDTERPDIRSDLDALRSDIRASVRTTPARLVAGLAVRRAADAGPLTVVSCDNLPENGVARRPGGERFRRPCSMPTWPTGSGTTSPSSPRWSTGSPRQPPRTTSTAVAALTGRADAGPVVTEPFTEWVLSGEFPGGRPAWEDAGARFVDDITPFEERKLWLLNGAHSLLAYAGSARGHQTIAEAVTDPVCLDWMNQWWAEASRNLTLPGAGCRGLPGRAVRAVREPADPAPARADRRRRIPEAPGSDPADGPARACEGRPSGRCPAGRRGVDQPPPRRRRAGQGCRGRPGRRPGPRTVG